MCNAVGQSAIPPGKAPAVGGASGKESSAPAKAEGCSDSSVQGQAGQGAELLGGGPNSGLLSALQALSDAIAGLQAVIEQLAASTSGGGGMSGCDDMAPEKNPQQQATQVNGVFGGASTSFEPVSSLVALGVAPTEAKEDHAFEARVTELVNAERAKYGLSPLRYSGVLDRASEKHSNHMAQVGRMAHDGIGDGTPGERIRGEGFRNSWGENVATGQLSPEQVVAEWMASPTHRANILKGEFTQIGVAYTTAANGWSYWAQSFGAG